MQGGGGERDRMEKIHERYKDSLIVSTMMEPSKQSANGHQSHMDIIGKKRVAMKNNAINHISPLSHKYFY